MAVELTFADRDLINRVVATEADHRLAKSNPDAYFSQVAGIVDTILNRVASPQYPDTVAEVVNQKNQFSAINGPTGRGYTVWGSADKVPNSAVPAPLPDLVGGYLNQRIDGRKSSVGGNLNYANPKFSDAKNLTWINALDGPRYGDGDSVHYHGTTKGSTPVEAVLVGDAYNGSGVKLPPGSVPDYGVGTLRDLRGPTPTSTKDMAAKINRMFDRVDPMPRSDGTLARVNAMLDKNEAVASTPLPRPRPVGIGSTASSPSNVTAPTTERTPARLPDILPAGKPPAQATPPAAAPANVAAATPSKYITTYEKKEIPLGDVMHFGSRDTVAQAAAGQAAGEKLKTITRKVTTLNPEWVKAQSTPPAPVVGRPEAPPEEGLGQQILGGIRTSVGLPREGLGGQLLGGIRTAIGIPEDGFGPGIARGFQRMTAGIGMGGGANNAPVRTPLSQQQIAAAQAKPSNHNQAALAAISKGDKSYTDSNGSLQPTTAMNGKVRNTYGD